MTICRRPVAIDASIAAKVAIGSIETSTARMRGCATAASTHATLAALMRKNAQVPSFGAPGQRGGARRRRRASPPASICACASGSVTTAGGPVSGRAVGEHGHASSAA